MNKKNNPTGSKMHETGFSIRYIDQEGPLAFFSFDQTSLQEVIGDLPDGYYETNLRGDLIAFNRALCRIHGYPPETMAKMNYRDYTPTEYQDAVFQVYSDVYKTGRPVQVLDFQVKRPDGSICIIHTSVHLIRDRDGKPTGFRGISKDVSEQKRNEAYEKARTQILEGIARNVPLEDTLEDILEALKEQIPDCAGMVLRASNQTLQYTAGIGIPEDIGENSTGQSIAPDEGACSKAAFYREPMIIDCVETSGNCPRTCEVSAKGTKAVWAWPVLGSEKEVLGVIVLYPSGKRKPTENEMRWLHSATATAELAFSHHNTTSELAYLSRHDPLTGLLNRRFFMIESEKFIALSRRKGWTAGILFMDLDRFKEINDTWGHQTGDMVLRNAAKLLYDTLRRSDTLARLGGDEFAVFIPETDFQGARIAAERILDAMAKPFEINGISTNLGISIGIALCEPDTQISADNLLVKADEAMYQAKRKRTGWAFYEPEQHRKAKKTALMESRLRRAISNKELLVHYQPIRDLCTSKWAGVEALVRWHDPEQGILNASEFLSIAESRGIIKEIDRFVLPRALQETRNWEGWVSVNVSPLSLYQPDWPAFVRNSLETHLFPPKRLILEVTERILLDMEKAGDVLEELSKMGVRIALDDFGTGYSSLGYLAKLSIHCLKIDRRVIESLESDEKAASLVRTILAMGQNLKIPLSVQGVEHQRDLKWLTEQGCGMAQGFFLARPTAWQDLDFNIT